MNLKFDKKTVREIYGILLSLTLVAVGACFIGACISIYAEGGESPFSRERVAEAISSIAASIWIFLAVLVCAIPLHFLAPSEKEKLKPYKMSTEQLKSLTERLSLPLSDGRLAALEKERSFRRALLIGAIGLSVIMLVYPLVYLFIPSNFGTDAINDDIAHAILSFLPSIAVISGAAVAYSYLSAASVEREYTAIKQTVKEMPSLLRAKKKAYVDKTNEKWILAARIFFLLLSATFIVLGIFNGGMKDVLSKAIKLCTECVGLG